MRMPCHELLYFYSYSFQSEPSNWKPSLIWIYDLAFVVDFNISHDFVMNVVNIINAYTWKEKTKDDAKAKPIPFFSEIYFCRTVA